MVLTPRAHAIWVGPGRPSHDPITRGKGVSWMGSVIRHPWATMSYFYFLFFDLDQQMFPIPFNFKTKNIALAFLKPLVHKMSTSHIGCSSPEDPKFNVYVPFPSITEPSTGMTFPK